MAPNEPTRHQLSSRLAYNAQTPAFLLKLQNQVAGRSTDDSDEDEPQYLEGIDEFGRERRPAERRPAIPERPEDDRRGSDDEDDADEKPMVVVLKEGKHLTELEAKNEKRKAEGLPPLPLGPQDLPSDLPPDAPTPESSSSSKPADLSGLSFSSKSSRGNRPSAAKRKAPDGTGKPEENKQNPKKKSKKDKKALLSFDRDDLG